MAKNKPEEKKTLHEHKLDKQKEIGKSRNLISSKVKICCRGMKILVDEKVVVYFKGGSHWCGIPNDTLAINYDLWLGNGCNCLQILYCPFCRKEMEIN